jgi:hypothetical protein
MKFPTKIWMEISCRNLFVNSSYQREFLVIKKLLRLNEILETNFVFLFFFFPIINVLMRNKFYSSSLLCETEIYE